MKRIGSVTKTAQGLVIASMEEDEPPDVGVEVVDEQLETVGEIVDVFGPVTEPYVAIAPVSGYNPASVINEKVYVQ